MITDLVSKKYLEDVRRRCEMTTSGPWVASIEGKDHLSGDSVIMRGLNGTETDLYLTGGIEADYQFIAHSKQDIPRLLDEILRLRRILEDKNFHFEQN